MLVEMEFLVPGDGKIHGAILGIPSRIFRAGDDNQTMCGPVLESLRWR